MHPTPLRSARIGPRRSSSTLLLATLLFALIPAVPPAWSQPAGSAADPDVPSSLEFPGAARPSFLRRDFDRLASSRSLSLLVTGGALALAVRGQDNADRAESVLDRPGLDGGLDVGTAYGHGATLGAGALALLAAGWLAHDENLTGAGSEVVRSLAYTGIAVTSLKMAVGRTRPNGGIWSFPSGHTAAAFAVAPVLSRRFGAKVAIPAYAIAVATGLGRMEDRKHYLSDVLAGAAIGIAVGRAVASDEGEATPGTPRFLVGPGGAGVAISF